MFDLAPVISQPVRKSLLDHALVREPDMAYINLILGLPPP